MTPTLTHLGEKRIEAPALYLRGLIMEIDAQRVQDRLALGRGHELWRHLEHPNAEPGRQGALGDPQIVDLPVSSLVDYKDDVSVHDAGDVG